MSSFRLLAVAASWLLLASACRDFESSRMTEEDASTVTSADDATDAADDETDSTDTLPNLSRDRAEDTAPGSTPAQVDVADSGATSTPQGERVKPLTTVDGAPDRVPAPAASETDASVQADVSVEAADTGVKDAGLVDAAQDAGLRSAPFAPPPCVQPSADAGVDTDRDGVPDVVDTDDDEDGIPDDADSAPLDPRLPGNGPVAAPGRILSDPCMQKAIAEVRQQYEFPIHLGHCAPNLAGVYSRELFNGTTIESDSDTVYYLWGLEYRVEQEGEVLSHHAIEFGNEWAGTYVHRGIELRASTEGHSVFFGDEQTVMVGSRRLDPESGSLYDVMLVATPVAPPGDTTCPEETVWTGVWEPFVKRVTDLSELNLMCVDGQQAYIFDETWTKGDTQCTCSEGLGGVCQLEPETPSP